MARRLPALTAAFLIAIFSLTCILHAAVLTGKKWVTATRYPQATKAGALMLQQGGNAFDAVVAELAALGVVDPATSGLGADVFILAYSAEDKRVVCINGSGIAPEAATIDWYAKYGGLPPEFPLLSGLVPGAFDAWVITLGKWGTLTLEEVLAPAIHLAEGWKVTGVMEKILKNKNVKEKLLSFPSSRKIYYKEDGSPYLAGEVMVNDDLAYTMERLVNKEQAATTFCWCRDGNDNNRYQALKFARNYFYKCNIAIDFADFCRAQGGLITYSDMLSYHALMEAPAHINYRGYDVYTPPSASQGPAQLEALKIMGKSNLISLRQNSSQLIHTMAEAMNLSYADREKYLGDFNFIRCPLNGLLSGEYAEKRKALINPRKRRAKWPSGNPYPFEKPEYTYNGRPLPESSLPVSIMYHIPADESAPAPKTLITKGPEDIEDILQYKNSYACAADRWGNLVYATSSLGSPFGSGVVIEPLGFPLNCGINYFRLDPDHANALSPGKRPRSTLTPTIVCKDGKPYLAFSVPTGDGEPQALSQALVNILDYGMDIQEAMDAPMWRSYSLPGSFHPFTSHPGVLAMDERFSPETIRELEKMGWEVKLEERFFNNPECALIKDPEDGTLRVRSSSGRPSALIAW